MNLDIAEFDDLPWEKVIRRTSGAVPSSLPLSVSLAAVAEASSASVLIISLSEKLANELGFKAGHYVSAETAKRGEEWFVRVLQSGSSGDYKIVRRGTRFQTRIGLKGLIPESKSIVRVPLPYFILEAEEDGRKYNDGLCFKLPPLIPFAQSVQRSSPVVKPVSEEIKPKAEEPTSEKPAEGSTTDARAVLALSPKMDGSYFSTTKGQISAFGKDKMLLERLLAFQKNGNKLSLGVAHELVRDKRAKESVGFEKTVEWVNDKLNPSLEKCGVELFIQDQACYLIPLDDA